MTLSRRFAVRFGGLLTFAAVLFLLSAPAVAAEHAHGGEAAHHHRNDLGLFVGGAHSSEDLDGFSVALEY
jgi:hypothetical protein